MDSSEVVEGWNLLRKWNVAKSTICLSFVGIGDAISFEGLGVAELGANEKRLEFEGKGWSASVDLTEVAIDKVVSERLLSRIGRAETLPESLELCLRTGDRCTLAVPSSMLS